VSMPRRLGRGWPPRNSGLFVSVELTPGTPAIKGMVSRDAILLRSIKIV
jgi:hypothetical protein